MKILKQMTIVALVIYSQSALAMLSRGEKPQYLQYIGQGEMAVLYLAAHQLYKLGRAALEKPNEPDQEWITFKMQEYDPLANYIKTNLPDGEAQLAMIENKEKGIASNLYEERIMSLFRKNGIDPHIFQEANARTKAREFEQFYQLALNMIRDNKLALAARNDQGTEYYEFARRYVNILNKEIARLFALHGTLYLKGTTAPGISFTEATSPEIIAVKAAAKPV